jgi:hypothetical protein
MFGASARCTMMVYYFKFGSLWPDALIQLNPTFKPRTSVSALVT